LSAASLLQAAIKPATAKIANTFFIVLIFLSLSCAKI
jgi:hypothetical protein